MADLDDQLTLAFTDFLCVDRGRLWTGDPRLMESSEWTRIGSNGETPYMDYGDTPTIRDLPDTTFRVFQQLWPPNGKAPTCTSK